MISGRFITLLFALASIVPAETSFGEDPAGTDPEVLPLPTELADLTGKYQAAMARIDTPLAQLKNAYKNRVQTLLDQAQKRGDLESVLVFKKEIEALGKNGPGQASVHPELAKAQTTYHEHAIRVNRENAPARLNIENTYIGALRKLMSGFTQEGKIDSGLVVKKALVVAEERATKWSEESAQTGIGGSRTEFDWEALAKAWKPDKFSTTTAVGGSTTLRSRDRDIPDEPALLIGFEIWLRPFRDSDETVRGVVPLFRTESGKTFDGIPRAAGAEKGKRRRVIAKDGYVVGGLKATSENAIRSMAVIFHKLTVDGTDPADSYESDFYGEWEGGNTSTVTIGDKVPVGVDGYFGLGLDQLAIITAEQ